MNAGNLRKLRAHGGLALALLALASCQAERDTGMVGTLERDRIEIKVESNEPIVTRHVQDGQAVQAGDPIMQQATERLQAHVDQRTARRDQAAARLAELVRGPRAEAIRASRARLEAAHGQSVNAAAELERARALHDRELASQAVLDIATARHTLALGEEQALREQLEAQLAGTTVEELDQARAALAQAEAQLALARVDLQRATLLAPVDGIVDRLLYQVGERPPAGSTVAVLLDSARTFARVYVPEHLKASVRPGDRLRIKVDGFAAELQGTVRWVSADASFTPYFALTEHDRSRLAYLAEVDVPDARELPSGLPLLATPAGD